MHLSVRVLEHEGAIDVSEIEDECQEAIRELCPKGDPVIYGARLAEHIAACLDRQDRKAYEGRCDWQDAPFLRDCLEVTTVRGDACLVIPPDVASILRAHMDELRARNAADELLATDAAAEVKALVGPDGTLELSGSCLPSDAMRHLYEAARLLLTSEGASRPLGMMFPDDKGVYEVLAEFIEAYRLCLVAASAAYDRLYAAARGVCALSGLDELRELWRMSAGNEAAREIGALLDASTSLRDYLDDPDAGDCLLEDLDTLLGPAGAWNDPCDWIARCSLAAQRAALWVSFHDLAACRESCQVIGGLWPGLRGYGRLLRGYLDFIEPVATGEVEGFAPLTEVESVMLLAGKAELSPAFFDGCELVYAWPSTDPETGVVSLACMSRPRKIAALASALLAEQTADDPESLTARLDALFEEAGLAHGIYAPNETIDARQLRDYGLDVADDGVLLVTGMGDCFVIEAL